MAWARACTRSRSRSSRFDASMKIDVLSIGAFPEATNDELANRFAVTRHFHRPAPDALGADLKSRIRAIATEANRGADRALIAALPKLEVIAIFGVGTDFVDLAAARERNVPVTNTPGILTDEVADLAIGLMQASLVTTGDCCRRCGRACGCRAARDESASPHRRRLSSHDGR